jgi:hypothetical protein
VHWSTSQAPHIDGIYYDGINFDRRSMMRVRKVLNAGAAASGRAPPLVDMHTGDNGATAPAATRYLSHFAYADSAWNGEGFDWARGPAYWLVDASAFIHGIAADRLGGGSHDFKALLFAMYTRNSHNAPAIWDFWRKVDIGAMEMVGWWADHRPVTLELSPPGPPRPCTQRFASYEGAYPETSRGSSGNIGFGGACGAGEPTGAYPPLTVDEAKAICCELHRANGTCVGFSFSRTIDSQGRGTGCLKKDSGGGIVHNDGFDGYELPQASSQCSTAPATADDPEGAHSALLATSHVAHGRMAVVVLASWCATAVNVTLALDWDALGLQPATSVVSFPTITGVQTGDAVRPSFPAADARLHPVTVEGAHGVVLVVSAAPM